MKIYRSRYGKTSVFRPHDKFESIGELWEIETKNGKKAEKQD